MSSKKNNYQKNIFILCYVNDIKYGSYNINIYELFYNKNEELAKLMVSYMKVLKKEYLKEYLT